MELNEIQGGIHIHVGAWVAAIALGALGGPAGLGIALSGIVIAEGVQNLADLGDEHIRTFHQ